MKQVVDIFAKNSEDEFKNSVLQRPSINDHQHVHIDVNSPIHIQAIQTVQHMLADQHNIALNFTKYTLKCAFLGGLFMGTLGLSLQSKHALYYKKMIQYVNNNTFGSARIGYELIKPGVMVGGLMGATHFAWYKQIWREGSKNSYCYDLMVGNAIYGAVWTAVLWNPSKYYVGLYLGAGLGFLYYCVILNQQTSYDTQGFVVKFNNGLSDDERKKQEYRDKIHELGLNYRIQVNKMERI